MKQITLQIKVFILLILFIMPCNAIASEKLAPAGSKQGPEIFVQMAKESIIYFSNLKFTQEVQT